MSHETIFHRSARASVTDAFRAAANYHVDVEGSNHSPDMLPRESDIHFLEARSSKSMSVFRQEVYSHGMRGGKYYAAPVWREEDVVRRTVKMKFTVPDARLAHDDGREVFVYEDFTAAVLALPRREGEMVEHFQMVRGSASVKTKVVVETPKEKAVTRYFVHAPERFPNYNGWDSGFPTQAAARAAMVELLKNQDATSSATYVISPLVRRENGAPVLTGRRVITKATCELEVRLAKSRNPRDVQGWFVAMDCHH